MVLVNCNIFLWISAFCNNKSGGPQDVSSTRTSTVLGLINEGLSKGQVGRGRHAPPGVSSPDRGLECRA